MFKNYLIVAFRNLTRNTLLMWINVAGLGLGLGCCILMVLFIKHELTYDRFHENHPRMFRVVRQRLLSNGNVVKFEFWDTVHPPWLVEKLREEVPGVVQACAFAISDLESFNSELGLLKSEGEKSPQRVGLVTGDFIKMFTFPFLAGDPTTALLRPDGVVITEATAREIFGGRKGDTNKLIGQSLRLRDKEFVVTGVMADAPAKSSLLFDALLNIDANKGFPIARGGNDNELANWALASIFVETDEEQSSRVFEALNRWHGKDRLRPEGNGSLRLLLQPLDDVYWNTEIPNRYELQAGNPETVYILCALAFIIMFVACSNYATLSISESSGRAAEVGFRKVLGANPKQIMIQFWSEALILSFFAWLASIALAELLMPVFNGFVNRDLAIDFVEDGPALFSLLLVIGLLAGSYPAVAFSRLQPFSAMKGETGLGKPRRLMRALIILQYSGSIALMICVGVMIQQDNYVRDRFLGYNKEHVVIVKANRRTAGIYKREILRDPRIVGATVSDRTLTTTSGYSWAFYPLSDGSKITVYLMGVDVDYLRTLEIPLLEGRNFSEAHPSDRENAVLINETLAKELDIVDPVDKVLTENRGLKDVVIIGVVGDFHFKSLHEAIEPLMLTMEKFRNAPSVLIRIRSGNMRETIYRLKKTWNTIAPNVPFRFSFLDDNLKRQYRDEARWLEILTYSALFAISLSCIGLIGMTSLAVTKRTKEIGIRKVLGASSGSTVWLMSRDFFNLWLTANLVAWPVAHWAMKKWLAEFAYRIEPDAGIFLLAGALTLGIAQLTIFLQTSKVAYQNPVDALRYE